MHSATPAADPADLASIQLLCQQQYEHHQQRRPLATAEQHTQLRALQQQGQAGGDSSWSNQPVMEATVMRVSSSSIILVWKNTY